MFLYLCENYYMRKFIIIFIISFITFSVIEYLVSLFFDIDKYVAGLGWLGYTGVIILYGFKYHIFCCLIPFLFTSYKCRHKKCDHEHCHTDNK